MGKVGCGCIRRNAGTWGGVEARDRQLRFQLDSARERPPRDMSSSENDI
eukprot:gene25856-biopygen9512